VVARPGQDARLVLRQQGTVDDRRTRGLSRVIAGATPQDKPDWHSVTSVAVITSAVEVCFDTSNSAAAAPVALKKMILFNDLVDFFNQDNQRPRGY
jgi:hypothetical protein